MGKKLCMCEDLCNVLFENILFETMPVSHDWLKVYVSTLKLLVRNWRLPNSELYYLYLYIVYASSKIVV